MSYPDPPHARPQAAKLFALLLLICVGAAAYDTYAAARLVELSSDVVHSFLAANSILHGNILLSGWLLPSDDFYFTDTIPLAMLRAIFGSHPTTLYVFTALVYVLIICVCLAASLRSLQPSHQNVLALAIVVALAGMPLPGEYRPLLTPDSHTASTLFGLVALLLLDLLAKANRIRERPAVAAAFVIVTIATVASDPFALVFAFGPALLVLLLDLATTRDRNALGLCVIVVAACVIGRLTPTAIKAAGGMATLENSSSAFVAPGQLGRTVQGLFFGLLYGAGADIFGKPVAMALATGRLIRLAGWVLGTIAIVRRFRAPARRDIDLLDRMLLMSIAVVVVACVLSEMFNDNLGVGVYLFNGGAATRYLSPILIFGAVLAARSIPAFALGLAPRRLRLSVTGSIVLLAAVLLGGHTMGMAALAGTPSWVGSNPFLQVSQWLAARNLTCGVGGYWSASMITAQTGGRVTVRAVEADPDEPLRPGFWAADAQWFHGPDKPMFVIWQPGRDNGYNVNAASVTRTFGAPTHIESVAGFQVALLPQAAAGNIRIECGK